ncbi:organic cation/carnitine transporter 3-like [Quercus robur]|uniref:organic cation/carnitine transporter 3-like n=1 Tax=Quercus robur TaxID=38942 RepID=UPI0021615E19|nr:organic cation/carnitine transporter 3-like [Quercus robur]
MALPNTIHNLTEPHSTEQQTPWIKQVLPSLSLDETIEQIMGRFGWSQFLQAILVSVPTFFDAQQTFISIYTDAEPKWHFNFSTTCNRCQISKSDWSWPSWDESSQKTIISDWGFECASSFMIGLHASSFFIGSLIGGFTLAMLGDILLGRKNLLYLSCLIMSIVSLLMAFSMSIWMYSMLRLVSGIGRASIMTCSLILLTQRVRKR